jgi:hypothetical protein
LNKDPQAYDVVKQFMVHGPCGSINPNSSCMIGSKCSKHFPKRFYSETTIDEDGFPIYKGGTMEDLLKKMVSSLTIDL